MKAISGACLWLLTVAAFAADSAVFKFDFGPGPAAPGYVQVLPTTVYTDATGYGFEPGAQVTGIDRGGGDPLRDDFVAGDQPFFFSMKVPEEGNYRVTVTLGDAAGESTATIKAELRRLMVEKVHTASGKFATVNFIVNTRTPKISAANGVAAGEVRLKAPRESIQERWAWDDRITLEFDPGAAPGRTCVCAIEVAKVEVPTIFLLGDSTVCDQSREPYTSWGQMLTRFFKPEIAIANHAESGETYRDSIGRRRLDKVLSLMKPGDYLIMQFGHNDQKQIKAGNGGPFTTYQAEIKEHVDAVRARGGIPVIVSPMERRFFETDGKVRPTLADYAAAARQAAQELHVAFIDLNAMSIPFYEALGPDRAYLAFAGHGVERDTTHSDSYGAYEFAKCIVQGIKDDHLGIAQYIVDDFKDFDPAHPDAPEGFDVPPSPLSTTERPRGN
jgi:lysophospholipase L1-like esterase